MGVFDEKTDVLSHPYEYYMGKGRDVLLGWLVGRAGADLGLAHALTANDSPGVQQILASLKEEIALVKAELSEQRRNLPPTESLIQGMEAALQVKIQELQNQLTREQEAIESRDKQLGEFKSELQVVLQRMSEAESMVQQARTLVVNETESASQLREGMRRELNALQVQLKERQARDSVNQGLEENLIALIHEFQARRKVDVQFSENRDRELDSLRAEIRVCAERMALLEPTAQLTGQFKEGFRIELAALHAQLVERQHAESVIQGSLETLRANIENLQKQVGEKLRILEDCDAERAQRAETVEANMTVKLRALDGELKERIQAIESSNGGLAKYESDIHALLERMAQLENATRHAQTATASDSLEFRQSLGSLNEALATLQAKLSEQQREFEPAEALIQMTRETLQAKIQEVENQLAREGESWQVREIQLRETLRAELIALQAPLRERQDRLEARQSSLDGLENVSARIQAIEEDFTERIQATEHKIGELEQNKSEVRELVEGMGQLEFAIEQAQAAAMNDTDAVHQITARLTAELAALKAELNEQKHNHQPTSLIHRFEEALNAKIDEIQNQITKGQGGLAARNKQLEETFRSELVALQGRLSERQDRFEAQLLNIEKLGEAVANQSRGLEVELRAKLHTLEHDFEGMEKFKSELVALVNRISQLESSAQETRTLVINEAESVTRLGENLKAELLARQEREVKDSVNQTVEETFSGRIHDLHLQVAQKLSLFDSRDAEYAQWIKGIDTLFGSKFTELEGQLKEKLQGAERSREEYRSEMGSLRERMGQLEFAMQQTRTVAATEAQGSQQTAASLKEEIALVKAELSEQRRNLPPTESLIQGMEAALQVKIQELQNQLTSEQEGIENRDKQLGEFKSELQAVLQRISEAESMVQQARTLVVNEAESASQLREGMRRELNALQAQLKERQATFEDLQSHVSQKFALLDSRDVDLSQLKIEMQLLTRRMTAIASAAQQSRTIPIADVQQGAGTDIEIDAPKAQRDESDLTAGQKLENQGNGKEGSGQLGRFQVDSRHEDEKEQLRQIQERMSAEIERVRAELKEKSSRWKVRRGTSLL